MRKPQAYCPADLARAVVRPIATAKPNCHMPRKSQVACEFGAQVPERKSVSVFAKPCRFEGFGMKLEQGKRARDHAVR
jgi:hypothetical protein